MVTSESRRSNSFAADTVVVVLQLVFLPNWAIRAKAAFFFDGFLGFAFAAEKNTRQLRLAVSWATWANALFRVICCVRNHNHSKSTSLRYRRKTVMGIELEGEFEYFGALSRLSDSGKPSSHRSIHSEIKAYNHRLAKGLTGRRRKWRIK
jgi:hypothetical protein